MAKLTPKQKRFVLEWLVDLNGTQAAIRSGYSEKTASEQAARLLANVNVQAEIQKRQKKLQSKLELTQERVLQELAAIGFARVPDYVQIVEVNEKPVISITPTDALSPDKLAAIASIKDGASGIEIKLHDKVKSLELIGKHLGMFERGAGVEIPENNLLTALQNSVQEVSTDGIPELQQETDDEPIVVEGFAAPEA